MPTNQEMPYKFVLSDSWALLTVYCEIILLISVLLI